MRKGNSVIETLMVISGLYTIYLFFKPSKKHPKWREIEAERYFNGSVGPENPYETESRTHGLAFTYDKKTGKKRFKKQSKMILKHPFY